MPRNDTKIDAITLLKADHRAVEELFGAYEKATTDEHKEDIVDEICFELSLHAMVEEEIFYPACDEIVASNLLNEAYVEHDGAKSLIAELGNRIRDRKEELRKSFEENDIPLPTTCSMIGDPPLRGSLEAA